MTTGPLTDDSGALFIYETDSAEAVSALVAEDPFSANGVFERFELKPWRLVFSNLELLQTGGQSACHWMARDRPNHALQRRAAEGERLAQSPERRTSC